MSKLNAVAIKVLTARLKEVQMAKKELAVKFFDNTIDYYPFIEAITKLDIEHQGIDEKLNAHYLALGLEEMGEVLQEEPHDVQV